MSNGHANARTRCPKAPTRGSRAKVCAVDWNGDGRLELLVGDFATQMPDLPEPTAELNAEQDNARKHLESVQKRYGELVEKLYDESRVKAKEDREKLESEFKEIRKQYEVTSPVRFGPPAQDACQRTLRCPACGHRVLGR